MRIWLIRKICRYQTQIELRVQDIEKERTTKAGPFRAVAGSNAVSLK